MALVVFGSGLMVNTARAALDIFTNPNPEFERTAKFGLDEGEARGPITTRYQQNLDRIVYIEAGLGFYALASAVLPGATTRGELWPTPHYSGQVC